MGASSQKIKSQLKIPKTNSNEKLSLEELEVIYKSTNLILLINLYFGDKFMKALKFLVVMALLSLLTPFNPLLMANQKILKIATWEDVNTFDPGWMTSAERELTIMSSLYNGLIRYKAGSWEYEPDLATSWEISADKKAVTFKLKKGIQFHKGYGELTAEDVKYSFERIIDPAIKSPEKGTWSKLDHVEVIDKYTAKLVLKDQMVTLFSSVLPMNAGMIVSKKAVEEMGAKKFGFNPIGTGAYELVSWEPKKKVTLKANPNYHGFKPFIQMVEFLPITEDSTSETALKTGEIHIGRAALINLNSFKSNSNFTVISKPAMKTYWLGMTVNKPPFDNIKLRQAFRYAVDVDKIIEATYFGAVHRANSVLPPSVPGYWKDAPAYKKNISKAKQLMKAAGKPNGFDVTLYVPASDDERIMAEVIKADAAEAGINVDIETKEIGAFNEAANKGIPNAYIQFYTSTIDPSYIMQWFAGESWNPSQWRNTRYTQILAEGPSEPDANKRVLMYEEAQQLIDQDCWSIWLTNGAKTWISQSSIDLGGIQPNGRLAPWSIRFK